MRAVLLIAGLLAAIPVAVATQAPVPRGIEGGEIVVRSGVALEAAVLEAIHQADGVAWIGYGVPRSVGEGYICCSRDGDGCCSGCRLEGDEWYASGSGDRHAVVLEAEPTLRVFLRVRDGHLVRIRTFSADCPVDASGARVVWLDGVSPAQSLELMAGLIEGNGPLAARTRMRERGGGSHAAMAAVAYHRGSAPLNRMLEWARHAGDRDLRRQAIFWLSQRAGVRAAATIENAVLNDPDEEVKTHAVFALSQLPPQRGVPLLIRIARTHRVPKVRRQAIFWLGQSDDDRALEFIEDLLDLG